MAEQGPNHYRVAYVSVVHSLHDHRFLYKQCKGLVDHGYEVEYYVKAGETAVIQGVTIIPLPEHQNRFRRFLSTWKLLGPLSRKQYDAVHLVDPELLPVGILLKLITRSAVLFDAHEDYVDFVKHKYYLHKSLSGLISIGMKVLLRISARILDGMIFADRGTAQTFKIEERKVGYFHNFPMLSMFPEVPKNWGDRKYDVAYLGTMSKTSGVYVMLSAIKILSARRPTARCLFIGEPGGYMKAEVDRFIREHRLENNVEFTGRIPHGEVPAWLQDCKIGLVGLTDLPKFHRNIATKMFEYMASGMPVVSSDLPPERQFMNEGDHCLFVPPENPDKMAQAIETILSDSQRAQIMAENCRRNILENGYYAEKEIEKLVRFYDCLLSKGEGRR